MKLYLVVWFFYKMDVSRGFRVWLNKRDVAEVALVQLYDDTTRVTLMSTYESIYEAHMYKYRPLRMIQYTVRFDNHHTRDFA